MLERIEQAPSRSESFSSLTFPKTVCLREFSAAGNIGVRVKSLSPYFWGQREELLAASYIPGYRNSPPAKGMAPDVTVVHQESETPVFSCAENLAMIQDRWRGSPNLDLFHLAYAMTRIELLKRNLFPVHSICVGEEKHVLVVGPSGVGKTSILLNLLKQSPSWKVFSANKTVISLSEPGGMKGVAGTRTISRRAADAVNEAAAIQYAGRTAFMLPEDQYESRLIVPVGAVVLARLNDGHDRIEHLTPAPALHRLYPYFLDALNADVVMGGGAGVFAGTPPAGAPMYLASNLARLLKSTACCSVSGSMEFVTNVIRTIHGVYPFSPKDAF